MAAPQSIDEYLATVPETERVVLEDLRKTIQAAAPEATEAISYGAPAFKYRRKSLVAFAAFKNHCSFFPMSVEVLDALEKEVGPRRTAKGTIQFTTDEPLPPALVKKIVSARMKEIDAKKK